MGLCGPSAPSATQSQSVFSITLSISSFTSSYPIFWAASPPPRCCGALLGVGRARPLPEVSLTETRHHGVALLAVETRPPHQVLYRARHDGFLGDDRPPQRRFRRRQRRAATALLLRRRGSSDPLGRRLLLRLGLGLRGGRRRSQVFCRGTSARGRQSGAASGHRRRCGSRRRGLRCAALRGRLCRARGRGCGEPRGGRRRLGAAALGALHRLLFTSSRRCGAVVRPPGRGQRRGCRLLVRAVLQHWRLLHRWTGLRLHCEIAAAARQVTV